MRAEAGAIDVGGEHCEACGAVDADEAEQGGEEPEAMHSKDMRLKEKHLEERVERVLGRMTHSIHGAQQGNAAHGEYKAHLLHHGASPRSVNTTDSAQLLSEDIGAADKGKAQLRHGAHGDQDPNSPPTKDLSLHGNDKTCCQCGTFHDL